MSFVVPFRTPGRTSGFFARLGFFALGATFPRRPEASKCSKIQTKSPNLQFFTRNPKKKMPKKILIAN